MQIDLGQRRLLTARVGERHRFEADAVAGCAADPYRTLFVRHLEIEQRVQVREVEVVLVNAADRRQQRRQRGLTLLEHQQVHGHRTQADRLGERGQRDGRVGSVERQRAEHAEQIADETSTQGEPLVLGVQATEDLGIAIEQTRSQAEQLDLLGVIFARHHRLQVGLLTALWRTPARQAEGLARIACLGQESGQRGDHQDHHRQARERDQQRAVAGQRDHVLDDPEAAHDQAQRPARSLAARARQLVVQLRVLEVHER
ncbi:MAG TPA: hypothetical protein VMG12_30200 [Polyangiaceae bacterium]|nr:hypothetical protein [Polyangiaceae bacterium]